MEVSPEMVHEGATAATQILQGRADIVVVILIFALTFLIAAWMHNRGMNSLNRIESKIDAHSLRFGKHERLLKRTKQRLLRLEEKVFNQELNVVIGDPEGRRKLQTIQGSIHPKVVPEAL